MQDEEEEGVEEEEDNSFHPKLDATVSTMALVFFALAKKNLHGRHGPYFTSCHSISNDFPLTSAESTCHVVPTGP